MDKPSPQEHDDAHAREEEDRRQNCLQFKGIRLRKWGSWVSEIRMPKSREKLWLGAYPSAQQAARAYDAAVYCLRGPNAKFNFPNSVPNIPFASSLSRRQIQAAATKYALDQLPCFGPPDMDKPSPQEHDDAHAREEEDRVQNCRQFKGIRLRNGGRWVSEIRMPNFRQKLWVGTYPSAQQAARAYDAAVYCLRGPNAKLNFPNSVPNIPSASSLSRRQIQVAATKYALDQLPSIPPEEAASSSRSASVSETELQSDSQ